MDETYIKVNGKWLYWYRAVDKEGKTIEFSLTRTRNNLAAKRFLVNAIENDGDYEKIISDGSTASNSTLKECNKLNKINMLRVTGPGFCQNRRKTDS